MLFFERAHQGNPQLFSFCILSIQTEIISHGVVLPMCCTRLSVSEICVTVRISGKACRARLAASLSAALPLFLPAYVRTSREDGVLGSD